ncbi:hypothetical protein LOC54_10945 [Acetobacter sp. AN02]|uniref:DUF6587 family protein n=1 Tax=Acetobacter sp. AN02 TaxID=2894186 RepID=UPI0024342214|nr:DUF6587 family protein [Acetobacter sp. AN02]MDG6095604.1 hypothetical protein [Acetobacter sp. AN02]
MLGTMIAVLLVLACGLYWSTRLSPALGRQIWSGTSRMLNAWHAPRSWREGAARRASAVSGGRGCVGCPGCGDRGGRCH